MTRIKLVMAVFYMVAIFAAPSAWAAEIAVVDYRTIIGESSEMKRALTEIETMKTAMEKQLAEMEKELEGSSESLKRKRTVMSEAQVVEEETALKGKLREYRLKGQNMNEQLSNEVMLRRKQIVKVLEQVVGDIAKEDGHKVVFDSNSLLYADAGIDITEKVLERLNQHFENN